MENNGLERFAALWKKGEAAGNEKIYSETEIKKLKMKSSLEFSRSVNRSILFDFVHKGILMLGMLLLMWLYAGNTGLLVGLAGVTAIATLLIWKEKSISIRIDFRK